jgi:hypothetical protein
MSHDPKRPVSPNPVTNLVSYYPKPGQEPAFLALLEQHWPTLDRMGLVTKRPPQIWRAFDIRDHKSYFVELFEWKDGAAADVAHQSPEVMAIWEPMTPMLEHMQITEVEPFSFDRTA